MTLIDAFATLFAVLGLIFLGPFATAIYAFLTIIAGCTVLMFTFSREGREEGVPLRIGFTVIGLGLILAGAGVLIWAGSHHPLSWYA
jgi:hypothetical protein